MTEQSTPQRGYEIIDQPLYDTCHVDNSHLDEYRFFTVPIGTAGKTLADTNLVLSNCLPPKNSFLIKGIKAYSDYMTPYLMNAKLQLFIGSKLYYTIPFLETVMLGIKISKELNVVETQNFKVILSSYLLNDESSKLEYSAKTTIFLLGDLYRPVY